MLRFALLSAALLAASAPASALAQSSATVGKAEIARARGTRYRELTERGHHYPQLIRVSPPQGLVFAVVEATVRFQQDPARKEAKIPIERVMLAIGGRTVQALGSLDETGAFSEERGMSVPGANATGMATFEPVFLVPESAKNGTLNVGGLQVEAEFEGRVAESPDPAERCAIKILSAKRSDGIPDRDTVIGSDAQMEVGYVLRTRADIVTIEFELTGRVRNALNAFTAMPGDFRIDLGEGRTLAALGKHDPNAEQPGMKLSEDDLSAVRSEVQEDGRFGTVRASLAFPLPKGATEGRLLYAGAPVADFVVD